MENTYRLLFRIFLSQRSVATTDMVIKSSSSTISICFTFSCCINAIDDNTMSLTTNAKFQGAFEYTLEYEKTA